MEVNSTITPAPIPKSPEPEPESETPTRIHQTVKPLTFTNGVLKRHQSAGGHHHNHHAVVVTYKECLKNHAATLGGHALDGCGEFMPSPSFNSSDPTSLKCAACGCHRNFHRREPEDSAMLQIGPGNTNTAIEYQPHHRHHPPPPQPLPNLSSRSPNSASPPPISSSYYPSSAPHMLLALSSPHQDKNSHHNHTHNPHSHHHQHLNNNINILTPNTNLNLPSDAVISPLSNTNSNSRKRFRTKFTQHQKDKMLEFAERLEWKMQKRDEELVHSFCNDVEVDRNVFKVWMHNNKNNFLGKKDHVSINGTVTENLDENDRENHGINNGGHNLNHNHNHHQQPPHHIRYDNNDATHVGTNGSSSSS